MGKLYTIETFEQEEETDAMEFDTLLFATRADRKLYIKKYLGDYTEITDNKDEKHKTYYLSSTRWASMLYGCYPEI